MKKAKSLIVLILILLIAVVVLFFVNRSFKKNKTTSFVDETTGETITIEVDDSKDSNESLEDITVFMVEDDDITGFTVYGLLNESYNFALDEDKQTWKYVDDEAVDIDENVINECLGYFSNMTTSVIINGHEASEYGINEDSRYIIVEAGGNETKITFGDSNSMTQERYYVINDDYDNIYATKSGVGNLLSLNLDYYKVAEATNN